MYHRFDGIKEREVDVLTVTITIVDVDFPVDAEWIPQVVAHTDARAGA